MTAAAGGGAYLVPAAPGSPGSGCPLLPDHHGGQLLAGPPAPAAGQTGIGPYQVMAVQYDLAQVLQWCMQ